MHFKENVGFLQRRKLLMDNKGKLELMGQLQFDLFSTENYILPGTKLEITLLIYLHFHFFPDPGKSSGSMRIWTSNTALPLNNPSKHKGPKTFTVSVNIPVL